MSYIDAINQAATASGQAAKAKEDKGQDIMGKEDFLTLLVAQLKNQDPLNPDNPTEFTAQLAQFSSLEQLFNLNESMDNVASSVDNSQKLSALGMIGKEVTYADSALNFDGTPVHVGYSIDGTAKDVTLLLQQNGRTYATLKGEALEEGNHFMTWDGLDPDGNPAPTGDYTIVVQATAASGSIAAAPLIRSEVTGVDLDGGRGGMLFTKAGQVNVNDIKGVYDVGSFTGITAGEDVAGTIPAEVYSQAIANDATLGEAASRLAEQGYDLKIEGGLAYLDGELFDELNAWEAAKPAAVEESSI